MKTKQVALILYLISSFVAVLATILDQEVLMLLSKPTVIPAILFYYLSTKTQPVNKFLILILILNFIGDTLVLLEFENQTKIIMVPYFCSYLIFLKLTIDDVKKMGFNSQGIFITLAVFSFLMFIMYSLIQLFIDIHKDLVIPVVIYGIVLGSFCALASYSYYVKNAVFAFYLLMTAMLSVLSDVFYIIFNFIFHFPALNYVEFAIQLLSYIFMVKYFISKETRVELNLN